VNVEDLLGSVIRSALAGRGRRKPTRGTLRFLTGGRGSFLDASTLLSVAGIAWGLYETAMQSSAVTAATSPAAGAPPGSLTGPGGGGGGAGAPPRGGGGGGGGGRPRRCRRRCQ
jgi:hypothetical protein